MALQRLTVRYLFHSNSRKTGTRVHLVPVSESYMNRSQHSHWLVILLAVIFALSKTLVASAQQGYSLLIMLSVVQASPGARIEIAGSHFEPDIAVSFVLFQEGNETPLGTVTADNHGDFDTSVLLPYELPFGDYEFRGVDEKGNFAAVPFSIVPDPSQEENGEPRDEEDPLLAPMPTYAPGVSVTPMVVKEETGTPVVPNATVSWVPLLTLGGTVLAILLLVFWVRKRKV